MALSVVITSVLIMWETLPISVRSLFLNQNDPTNMTEGGGVEFCPEDIHKLLGHFSQATHKVKDGDLKGDIIMEKCLMLFRKDYKYSVIRNFNGELCGHYPSKIPLLEYEVSGSRQEKHHNVESIYDMTKMRELFKQARFARCRSRFTVPVILYEGKHICRSATLSSGAEMYGRSGIDFFFSGDLSLMKSVFSDVQIFDKYRGHDIKLLKVLSVGYICDLMVEKKKVKFGMNITSSEKVDKENRYADFCIMSIPYPGCEFFKDWKDNSNGEKMWFDWEQSYVDACLDIPNIALLSQVNIEWKSYKEWNLVRLTQNYLKLLIHMIREGDGGILVHCISGWDRTPMFVALLRLSLWADGVIHTSLSAAEILYLSIAYDWYLFGHNLNDRLSKGEEILFFCFNFLRHITSNEFSVKPKRTKNRTPASRTNSECNLDGGVLLDSDQTLRGLRGSDTSINSLSSCSVDAAPIVFSNSSFEEEVCMANGNSNFLPVSQRFSSSPRGSTNSDSTFPLGANHFPLANSSSPMAVPSFKRCADSTRANSPGCGSWQIISTSGSERGSSQDLRHCSSSSSRISSCHEVLEACDPPRKQRLDCVRQIFHNAYTNTLPSRNGAEGGRITNLLDQFAEKVGIRAARGTVV
ncbi:hypothetical protein ScPMuIL_008074 [Solemya velum]